MPKECLSMRKILEVLRLRHEGRLSHRAIGQSCGIGCTAARGKFRGQKIPFAVGMALTGHPPHRSRRAELPHRAPALGYDVFSRMWG